MGPKNGYLKSGLWRSQAGEAGAVACHHAVVTRAPNKGVRSEAPLRPPFWGPSNYSTTNTAGCEASRNEGGNRPFSRSSLLDRIEGGAPKGLWGETSPPSTSRTESRRQMRNESVDERSEGGARTWTDGSSEERKERGTSSCSDERDPSVPHTQGFWGNCGTAIGEIERAVEMALFVLINWGFAGVNLGHLDSSGNTFWPIRTSFYFTSNLLFRLIISAFYLLFYFL